MSEYQRKKLKSVHQTRESITIVYLISVHSNNLIVSIKIIIVVIHHYIQSLIYLANKALELLS